MAATVEVKCKNCKRPFMARVADRARGWAKFCSKSCKAKEQEKRTGQMSDYLRRQGQREEESWHEDAMSAMEEGWDGHKVWTT